jgi:hypothetical protein
MSDVIQYILKLKDEMSGNLKTIEKNTDGLNNTFKKVGGAVATYFAVDKIVAFGKESFKAFEEAEQNATKLTNAVKMVGGSSSDLEALMKQSSELQNKGIFSDDATQQIQTQALQFGLTAKQVQEMTPIVEDFASATGQSADSAMQSVLMGTNGMMRGLKAYGINLQDTGDKSKNLQQVMGALGAKFAGTNELIAKTTTAGQMAQFTNQVDDLQEVIGESLASALSKVLPYIIDLVTLIKDGLQSAMPYVEQFLGYFDQMTTTIGENKNTILAFFQPIIDAMSNTFTRIKEALGGLFNSVAEWMPQIEALLYAVRDAFVWVYNIVQDLTIVIINLVAGILDVAHTFYVLLDALGVINLLVGLFSTLWEWAKGLGNMFIWLFDHTLAPILSGIGWLYEKLKDILGLTGSSKVVVEQQKKATSGAPEMPNTTNAVAGGGVGSNLSAKGSKAKAGGGEGKVTGSKNTTIQITIQKFIDGGVNISTTTFKESASEMQTMIAKALLNAVNDAQLIATQ